MRISSRLIKAEFLASGVYVATGVAAAYEQDRAVREYLESLSIEELKELQAARIWVDEDPQRMKELGRLPPDELIALYQQELRNSSGGVSSR